MRGLVMGIAIISASWPFIKALAQDDSDMPKERWGKTVTAESPCGGETQKSDFATIVAPPGFAIAMDRLDRTIHLLFDIRCRISLICFVSRPN
jgi:hypothetical protein